MILRWIWWFPRVPNFTSFLSMVARCTEKLRLWRLHRVQWWIFRHKKETQNFINHHGRFVRTIGRTFMKSLKTTPANCESSVLKVSLIGSHIKENKHNSEKAIRESKTNIWKKGIGSEIINIMDDVRTDGLISISWALLTKSSRAKNGTCACFFVKY